MSIISQGYRRYMKSAASLQRSVFCPNCRRHREILKPHGKEWPATVAHVLCLDCGGDGFSLVGESVDEKRREMGLFIQWIRKENLASKN